MNFSKKLYYKLGLHCLIIFLSIDLYSQNFVSSNLPIVFINTPFNPVTGTYLEIQDDDRIIADLTLIRRPGNARNYIADKENQAFQNYQGKIDIEIRGSFSQVLPKKSYGFSTKKSDGTTNNNVSLLDMPADNDWVLNSLAFDPSLMRDFFCYNLYNFMGNYTTRTQYCEVVLNGKYQGLYLLQEKLKQGSGRINVTKIKTSEISQPELSGGYIIKADKFDNWNEVGWSMKSYNPPDNDIEYIAVLPKYNEIKPQQLDFIKKIFFNLETQAKNRNTSINDGIPSVIDINSFIDFMLISELTANVDAYQYSTYFHKERDGKLRAGPIWDNNLVLGNDLFAWGFDRSWINTWQFSNGDNEGSYFWRDLFNTYKFKCYLMKRWNELRSPGNVFDISKMNNLLDSAKILVAEASVNENQRWGTVPDLNNDIQKIKSFLSARINWMNQQFSPTTSCENVIVPPIVISKIHYKPAVSNDYPVSWSQEFIEISNTSSQEQDLTGLFFSGTGFSYQFPVNARIKANSSIFLARDTAVFRKKYKFRAFGNYNINLPDNSQKLMISDAWGNPVDFVEYQSVLPWPDASGNAYYLSLKNKGLDNNDPVNWELKPDGELVKTDEISADADPFFYPNPTEGELFFQDKIKIDEISVFSSTGQKLDFLKSGTNCISLYSYNPGLYIIVMVSGNEIITQKVLLK
ncbi:MAG: CotH kinase family protein [Deltaproteobacteria bacterium]